MSRVRRRLLFASQLLPYPLDLGSRIRTYNVVRQLAKSYDLTMLCFYRDEAGEDRLGVEERVRALSRFGKVEAFPIPQERSRSRLAWDHLRSLLTGKVYTRFVYDSRDFERRLREELAGGGYELVHFDSLDLARYLPLADGHPVVLTHHDATSVQLGRRAAEEVTALRRWYLSRQTELMRREEGLCREVSINITVSPVDRDTLDEIAGGGRFEVVPNGVDVEFFAPEERPRQGVVFVGGATWFPNRDALDFFCSEILPPLRERVPDVPVTWVGRASEEDRARYREEYGVELTGYVDDIRPYVHAAACIVVPLRIGSGTRVKILDAWAMGKAIVSTGVGAEGLGAVDGEHLLIRDGPVEFAEGVASVVTDPELGARLGRRGREYVEEKYSWDSIGERMRELYRRVAEEQTSGA